MILFKLRIQLLLSDSNFYKAGSNQQLFQRYYEVQNKVQEILDWVKILGLDSAAGKVYFPSLPPTSGIIRDWKVGKSSRL